MKAITLWAPLGTNFTIYFQPEDFWFSAPKKGIMVFALPGEPGLTEVASDFKIQFHDRQGDFYWWAPVLYDSIISLNEVYVFLVFNGFIFLLLEQCFRCIYVCLDLT